MTILIADGQEILRKGLVSLLRGAYGHARIVEAGDGVAVLREAKAVSPDVVIVDVQLPEVGGVEVARRLSSEGAGGSVVLLSQLGDAQTAGEAFEAGAAGYVLKQEGAEVLCEAVDAVMGGERYVSRAIRGQVPMDGGVRGEKASVGLGSLSDRQVEILAMIASGLRIREIARRTGLATKTLDAHRRRLQERLGVGSTAGLMRVAIREGLVGFDGEPAPERSVAVRIPENERTSPPTHNPLLRHP